MAVKIAVPDSYDWHGWMTLLARDGVKVRKIGHNTLAVMNDDGSVAIRLHQTDIVTFHDDGRVVLNSGGWQTAITRERMRAVLPQSIGLIQENYTWYVWLGPGLGGGLKAFEDGIVIHT